MKTIITNLLLFELMLLLMASCGESEATVIPDINTMKEAVAQDTLVVTVASHRYCRKDSLSKSDQMSFYMIKTENTSEWTPFYDPIFNFDYEDGYEYIISVARYPWEKTIQDVGEWKYVFIKLHEKKQKESEDIPYWVVPVNT